MSDQNKDNHFEGAISELFSFITAKDDAAELLISNLVKFLVDKGVINLDEYLEHTQKNKERLIDKIKKNEEQGNGEKIKTVIEQTFNWHIDDFKKSK